MIDLVAEVVALRLWGCGLRAALSEASTGERPTATENQTLFAVLVIDPQGALRDFKRHFPDLAAPALRDRLTGEAVGRIVERLASAVAP